MQTESRTLKRFWPLYVFVAAILAVVFGFGSTASAAVPGESAPGNSVAIPLTRIVDLPGIALGGAADTVQVAVAGQRGIPTNAISVSGRLVAYDTTGESLVVWDGVNGAPGDATVTSGRSTGSGASQAFTSALHNGNLSVHLLTGSGRFLLEISGYDLPVGAPQVGNVLHNSFGATVPADGQLLVAATCAGTADANLPADASYPIGGDAPNGAAAGFVAVSGGYSVGNGSGSVTGVNVSMSRDELTYTAGRGWLVTFQNTTDAPVSVRTWVVCLAAPNDNPND